MELSLGQSQILLSFWQLKREKISNILFCRYAIVTVLTSESETGSLNYNLRGWL